MALFPDMWKEPDKAIRKMSIVLTVESLFFTIRCFAATWATVKQIRLFFKRDQFSGKLSVDLRLLKKQKTICDKKKNNKREKTERTSRAQTVSRQTGLSLPVLLFKSNFEFSSIRRSALRQSRGHDAGSCGALRQSCGRAAVAAIVRSVRGRLLHTHTHCQCSKPNDLKHQQTSRLWHSFYWFVDKATFPRSGLLKPWVAIPFGVAKQIGLTNQM